MQQHMGIVISGTILCNKADPPWCDVWASEMSLATDIIMIRATALISSGPAAIHVICVHVLAKQHSTNIIYSN